MNSLTSPLGDVITDEIAHEGIVLRNEETFGVKMVKNAIIENVLKMIENGRKLRILGIFF